MDNATQALLFAVLGILLGGAAVLAWRVSEMQQARAEQPADPPLAEGVTQVLAVLRSSALVVDADDAVLKATAPAHAMGVVSGDKLVDHELYDLVRKVRRDGQIRELMIERPRTMGNPATQVGVRVAPLGSRLVLVLLEDRTREKQVEAIRRDFVANVSHELKTPVGAIRLLAEAVTDAAEDPDAVQRFAGRMAHESARLGRLVQQIIELSRLQDDDPLEEPSSVPVDDLVEKVIDDNATDASAKNIRVVHDGDTGLVLLGNRGQVDLALSNLVSNAVSYSPEDSTIVVSSRSEGSSVELAVSDQGIGIPAGEIDRIFERFYRVDPARHRSTGGTGLGLSIVKHVAASHGGDVRVWSIEGQGSTFTLALPRKLEHRRHRPPAVESTPPDDVPVVTDPATSQEAHS